MDASISSLWIKRQALKKPLQASQLLAAVFLIQPLGSGAGRQVFFSCEAKANEHDQGKHDQIEEDGQAEEALRLGCLIGHDAMGIDGSDNHEDRSGDGQKGEDKALEGRKLPGLFHEKHEDRNIKSIDGDDGQLRGIEAKKAEPGLGRKIGPEEIDQPEGAHQEGKDGRVGGHIGRFAQLAEGFGRRTVASDRNGIKASGGAKHEAVQGSHAGNCNKEVENIAQDIAKHMGEGDGGPFPAQGFNARPARDANVIKYINGHDDGAAHQEGNGQIALGIF